MRRTVVALTLTALLFVVPGCGGGGAATDGAPADAAPPADTPAAVEPAEPITDRSANDADLEPVPFPSFTTTETPAVITEKLDAGRPMLIFFFDPAQGITTAMRAEVDAAMDDYRGLVDLVTFDVGGPSDSDTAARAVTYATELEITTTPYLLAVDGNGFITWRWKGYVDRAYIEREVERASR